MDSLGENTMAALVTSQAFSSINSTKTSKNPLRETSPNIPRNQITSKINNPTIKSQKNPSNSEHKENTKLEDVFNESLVLTRSRYPLRSHKSTLTAPSKPKRRKNSKDDGPKEKSIPLEGSSSKFPEDDSNAVSGVQNSLNSQQMTKTSEVSINSTANHVITTQDKLKLECWGLPNVILRKYEARGLKTMFHWQVECLSNPRVLENAKNLVYSAPTSAGKTLVSEILIIKTVLERRKKAIFILPFVSVVREKMYYFQDLLSDSGIRVQGFMGGVHPPGGFNATDVAIATIEKANSLVNQMMEEGGLENLGAVVIDELHLLGDPFRGYLLELLLTKLKYMTLKQEAVNIQLIGMSATLPNLDVLAKWLDADLFKTDFRPVPLKELCKIGPTVYDNQLNEVRALPARADLPQDSDHILALCLETIDDGHSVLIFCPTKNWCETLAKQISGAFSKLGRMDTAVGQSLRAQLNTEAIIDTLEQLKRTPVGLDSVLESTVSFGVAYHHAGLTMDERDVVEGAFRSGALRVLAATSTLSSGVNLPARRVIIRTIMFHGQPIDTLTYKQMIGRAGRMGKDTAGESIIVCKPNEQSSLKNLLSSGLQAIDSCLKGPAPLIRALLEAVASEVAYTLEDIDTYTKCTLLSFTSDDGQVETSTKAAVDFLVENELLLPQISEPGQGRWIATQLGKACLAASVPPRDGLGLFEELQKARRCFVLDTELHVIYLVTPINSGNLIGQVNWSTFAEIWRKLSESDRRVGTLIGISEGYLIRAISIPPRASKTLDLHKRFYTALALHDLVREVPLHVVCRKYSCCRGVIQSLQQTAATFAGMVTQFCRKLGWNCLELLVGQFQARLQFGVCRELLDLLRLPMLNGLRARSLFKAGITTVAELAVADELDVERALHKALPFESEKEQAGEGELDAEKRKRMRTIFVTGRDGLTPREAAALLVKEARIMIQNELGVDDVHWQRSDRSRNETDSSCISIQPSSLGSFVTRTGSGISSLGEPSGIREEVASSARGEVSSHSPSLSIIQERNISGFPEEEGKESRMGENQQEVGKTPTVMSSIVIPEFASEVRDTGDKSDVQQMSKQQLSTPKQALLRDSIAKSSASRSPSLFGDSLGLDTQELNLLEQNVIDLDADVFDETNFSDFKYESRTSVNAEQNGGRERQSSDQNMQIVPQSIGKSTQNSRKKSRSDSHSGRNNALNPQTEVQNQQTSDQNDKFIKPRGLPPRPPSVSEENRSKSLIWEDDSWNYSNVILEKVNKLAAPEKSGQTTAKPLTKEKSDLEKIKIVQKRKFSSPSLEKSPIVKITAYNSPGGLSNGSNKSEDDIIFASQTMDGTGNVTKTRTRRKLESIRIRTQRTKTQNVPTALQVVKTCNSVGVNKMAAIDKVTNPSNMAGTSQIVNPAPQASSVTYVCNECSTDDFIINSDEEVYPEDPITTSKPKNLGTIPKNSEEKVKKPDFKEVKIIRICDQLRFNHFRKELATKTEISVALGCEAYLKDTVTIGTRIISTTTHQENGKRLRKVESCVYNDKKLCGIAFTWGRTVYYLSFENSQDPGMVPMTERMGFLTKFFASNITIRCFSTKETWKTLFKCLGIPASCCFLDPQVADWLLNPDAPEKNFSSLINDHLPEGQVLLQKLGPLSRLGPGLNMKSLVSSETRACTEALLSFWLLRSLSKKLNGVSEDLLKTFRGVEMPTVVLLARMEMTGLGTNLPALQELAEVIQSQLRSLEEKAFAAAGKKFNFSSSKSVAGVLGMDTQKKVSTNKAVLESSDHPIARLVINWRKLNSTHSKMVCPLLLLAERSSRIRGTCVTHTATGRVSMHEPNLQNVPKDFESADGDFVVSVRMAFIPSSGNVILSADYCQLELRILAHFSGESKLQRVLRRPGDVFRNIAARWYNEAEERITDTMRQRTKQLCYGMIYGMGLKSLAEVLQVEEAEAKEFLEAFMSAYPGIRGWLTDVVEKAKESGFVETLAGRRRYFPGLKSEDKGERGQAERQAVNTKVQGSAADIAKIAMILVDERIRAEFPELPLVMPEPPVRRRLRSSRDSGTRGGFLILQLHDELLYEVNRADLNRVARIIKESMENAGHLDVPLPVRIKVGPAWGDLEEFQVD